MKTWSLRLIRYFLRLALSGLRALGDAASAIFNSRADLRTIRRECLDHVIVINEASLYRDVRSFVACYHESRTHLSLAENAPEPRPAHAPDLGPVFAIRQVGGLHHRRERSAD